MVVTVSELPPIDAKNVYVGGYASLVRVVSRSGDPRAPAVLWTLAHCPLLNDVQRKEAYDSIIPIFTTPGVYGGLKMPATYARVDVASAPARAAWRAEYCRKQQRP